MINDEQHEQLKKLIKIAKSRNANGYFYDSNQRHAALEDIADIVDPEHWNRGLNFKDKITTRLPDDVLNDSYQPNNQRKYLPTKADATNA